MLSLKGIVKSYKTGDLTVRALDDVSVDFRKSEFVSVLGPSGCGKTTLLNIIGGLDRYEKGEMSINGVSTKQYKDKDWDSYRNHRIGFVFQSYNLIPHQTVLSNVELALTLSGVSKAERKRRAIEVLNQVGLGDQLNKKPNQMSGGQMQRVAIARALVNNPDILLADEPTGALDSETSLQIMEILRSISKDKLIIMVTHNPELAEQYSSRIIKLLDGKITDDSNPLNDEELAELRAEEDAAKSRQKAKRGKKTVDGKTSMSGFTALSLSLNNLMTKKARSFLTSFAGSIGIIGIALILSISNGIQAYIDKTEEEAVSNYPIMIENTAMDLNALMGTMTSGANESFEREDETVYSKDVTVNMIESAMTGLTTNNLKDFKAYLEENYSDIENSVNDISYNYSTVMNVYKADTSNGVYKVNPSGVMDALGMGAQMQQQSGGGMSAMMSNTDVWMKLLDNTDVLDAQYDVMKGRMPEKYNEVVIILDENGDITDYTLYSLGLKDSAELKNMMKTFAETGEIAKAERSSYSYDELLDLKFKLLVNTDYFEKVNGRWVDRTDDDIYVADKLNNAIEIKVVGLVKPSEDAEMSSSSYYGMVGYRSDLMTELVNRVNESEIVADQKADETVDIFTGLKFKTEDSKTTMEDINNYIASLPAEDAQKAAGYIASMRQSGASDEKIIEAFEKSMGAGDDVTLEGNYELMGVSSLDDPSSIYIYPKDFESKDAVSDFIEKYNSGLDENEKIVYNDYIGLMLSSITIIINAISYVLIAFVGISLVVSSIMIGIITYISVLERTKEIGILRSIGASKRDVARLFNAEALILGFIAGAIGIGATLLLCIPINSMLHNIAEINANAALPIGAAVILVAISMFLTFIAGLIPSRIASKKDPVIALRTE